MIRQSVIRQLQIASRVTRTAVNMAPKTQCLPMRNGNRVRVRIMASPCLGSAILRSSSQIYTFSIAQMQYGHGIKIRVRVCSQV